jgi:tetratricopeptide (TPR) repeat protein
VKKSHLIALLAIAFTMRILWPLADPPARLTWSNGEITDPPAIVHAARNVVLFGEWQRDESKDLVFFPLLNAITAGAFALFGANRLVLQVLSALFATGAIAATAWALRRANAPAQRLAPLLIAVSFWIVMFSRIPVAENLVILLLPVAAGFSLGETKREFFLAGLLAGVAAFFGKIHALAFFPAAVLFVFRRRSFAQVLQMCWGMALAAVLWIALIFIPFHHEILDQVHRSGDLYGKATVLRSPIDFLIAPFRALRFSWLSPRFFWVVLLGGWFAISTLATPGEFRRRVENGTGLFALWVLFAWMAFSFLPYIAPRYFVLIALPLAACAAFQIAEWRAGTAPALASLRGKRGRLIAYVWLIFLFYVPIDASNHWISFLGERLYLFSPSLAAHFLAVTDRWSAAVEPFEGSCLVAFLSGTMAFLLLTIATRRPAKPSMAWSRLAALCLAGMLGFDLVQFIDWVRHKDYALEEAKKSFDAIIAPDAVVSGAFASALVLGTQRIAVPFIGTPRPGYLEERNATHLVAGEPGDISGLEQSLPNFVSHLRNVRSWPLRTRHTRKITVFRIEWPDTSGVTALSEPTQFERAAELIEVGAYDAAFLTLEAIRNSGMEIPDVYSLLAECRMRTGDRAGAQAFLEKALEMRPSTPQDLYNLAVLLYDAGDRRRAHELWLRGLRLDPDDIDLVQAVRQPYD